MTKPDDPCPDVAVLARYLNDELPKEVDSRVGEHINTCTPCNRQLDALQQLSGDVRRGLSALVHADDPSPELEGYDVLDKLGAGGMGVVWRVRDTLCRDVALKVMRTGLFGDPKELTSRFLNERRICANLDHPSIVVVYEEGELGDGRPYYSMKLVVGQSFADLRRAPVAEWLPHFAKVCEAVGYAHSRGVIHRDLKPANIMIGQHGEVQVMDWGLAKRLADNETAFDRPPGDTRHEAAALTRNDSVLGTAPYMSPEQARGQVAEVDQRSDVFGLGAILCELLTGSPPYTALGRDALLQ